MIELPGLWYPKHSAAQSAALLELDSQVFRLRVDGEILDQGEAGTLSFSQRVGNIPRRISFADGSVLVCDDNDRIDQWLAQARHSDQRFNILHRLESQWRWIALSIVLVLGLSAAFVWKGIPWLSGEIAAALPTDVYQSLGTGTLAGLDKWLLAESELPAHRQQQLSGRFEQILAATEHQDYRFKLHFRAIKDLPNAFALPSGDIVVTDELIALAERDEEIDAVLLHEIAHVLQRHGLQRVIHSSAITVIVTLLLGDATSLSGIAVALPTFLLESSYSREQESEADEFALQQMVQQGIDPVHFASIMRKFLATETPAADGKAPLDDDEDSVTEVNNYLSSHPATEQRIQRALEFSRQHQE